MQQTPPEALDLLIVGAGFGGLYMLHTARQPGCTALVVEAARRRGRHLVPQPLSRRACRRPEPGVLVSVRRGAAAGLALDRALRRRSPNCWPMPTTWPTASTCVTQHPAEHPHDAGALGRRRRCWRAAQDTAPAAAATVHGDGHRPAVHAQPARLRGPGLQGPRAAHGGLAARAGDVTGLRVGVIGTGSSGVQTIPPSRGRRRS
jgi:hypothetical protein